MAFNGPQVPMFSAAAANQGVDLNGAITRVIESHWYVLGREVQLFETEFARYVGTNDCISVANGTDALELALRGCGVGAGDLVATVANAGFYSSIAIHGVGAVPLYVDVDAATLTMSSAALEEAIGKGLKAIVVTHLYGQLADIQNISAIARKAGVLVIEDCAQAHGASRCGKQAGSFGAVGCFSFYPTKNLGAVGDGGAVVTSDAAIAERLRQLRQYGWKAKYEVAVPDGRNSRLDEIQAAVLREKLPHLAQWNEQRREIARRYNEAFGALPVRRPASMREDYVAHLYVVRVAERTPFREYLGEQGVATDIHYPIPDHRQDAYKNFVSMSLAATEEASTTAVSLPCFPGMSDAEVSKVIAAVHSYFDSRG